MFELISPIVVIVLCLTPWLPQQEIAENADQHVKSENEEPKDPWKHQGEAPPVEPPHEPQGQPHGPPVPVVEPLPPEKSGEGQGGSTIPVVDGGGEGEGPSSGENGSSVHIIPVSSARELEREFSEDPLAAYKRRDINEMTDAEVVIMFIGMAKVPLAKVGQVAQVVLDFFSTTAKNLGNLVASGARSTVEKILALQKGFIGLLTAPVLDSIAPAERNHLAVQVSENVKIAAQLGESEVPALEESVALPPPPQTLADAYKFVIGGRDPLVMIKNEEDLKKAYSIEQETWNAMAQNLTYDGPDPVVRSSVAQTKAIIPTNLENLKIVYNLIARDRGFNQI